MNDAATWILQTQQGNGSFAPVGIVQRSNMPEVELPTVKMFDIDVQYSADHVAVDDILEITARFAFTPPANLPGGAPDVGMVVIDVAAPTGFAPVVDTVSALVGDNAQVKRYDIVGRKVILYLEDLLPDDTLPPFLRPSPVTRFALSP